jgi:phage baseplate assembly protein W
MSLQRSDKYIEVDRKRDIYSDFFCDLTAHPNTKDIVRNSNEAAVKRAIRNLFLTDKYERMFNPTLGSNVRKLLFEPMSSITAGRLKTACEETITNHEPRAKLIDVEVFPSETNQSYKVNIYFYIINKQEAIATSVILYRVR